MSTAKNTDLDYVREYLRMVEALNDIRHGCDMMTPIGVDGAFGRFVTEVRRVAAVALEPVK